MLRACFELLSFVFGPFNMVKSIFLFLPPTFTAEIRRSKAIKVFQYIHSRIFLHSLMFQAQVEQS
jgi:hypothetical protein